MSQHLGPLNPHSIINTWSHQGFDFKGCSISGIRTCMGLPQLDLCFDVAQGLPFALNFKKFFITHGHLDHAAGIPYIISQKALSQEKQPPFYMPASLLEPLNKIMRTWEEIEKHEYHEDFNAIDENSKIEINPQYFVQPFRTFHRIESFGYTLFRKTKKLKPEYKDLPQQKLKDLGSQGTELTNELIEPFVSFTGDTKIEFIAHSEAARTSKILFLECTYLDDKRPVQHARDWGHTHLDEIVENLDQIKSEKVVLIHLSARYSFSEAQKIVQAKVPQRHLDRIVIFPY